MVGKGLSILVAAASLMAAGSALGQTSQPASSSVAPVTVTGKTAPKRWVPAQNPIPPELGADTEACWQVSQDPSIAATQGDAAAQAAIGTYFYRGEGGLPHDGALARKWFEMAATGGDPDGMFKLAAMQARGEGGSLDRVKAWG